MLFSNILVTVIAFSISALVFEILGLCFNVSAICSVHLVEVMVYHEYTIRVGKAITI